MNYLLLIISVTSLALAAPLIKWTQAPLEFIGFYRLAGASLLLFIFALLKGHIQEIRTLSRSSSLWIAISGLTLFLHLWTYAFAAQNTSIAHAMIIFATNPLFTALISRFLLREAFPLRLYFVYALALAGVVLLFSEKAGTSPATLNGDLSAILASFFYSLYVTTGKKARLKVSNWLFAPMIYALVAILFFAAGTLRSVDWAPTSEQNIVGVLMLVLIPTICGHALFTTLLTRFNINWMSCAKLIEPAISSVTALFIFSERITARSAIAYSLTVVSILVLIVPELGQKKLPSEENQN